MNLTIFLPAATDEPGCFAPRPYNQRRDPTPKQLEPIPGVARWCVKVGYDAAG